MSSPLSPGQGVHKLGFQAGVADILWGSGSRVAGTSGGGARWSIWGYGISKGVICSNAGLGGLYSPPGILPAIRLESQNSARLISEFDILAESAQNIMGIVFLLLCLVILYRVRPESVKKKLNSMECLVDFHGTSPRSSCEIIHVMISRANLNL